MQCIYLCGSCAWREGEGSVAGAAGRSPVGWKHGGASAPLMAGPGEEPWASRWSGVRWAPCFVSLCVTTGHTLTSAPLALIRRRTATSRAAAPPTWPGAPPLHPAAPLEDPAWGPQDPCPCCLRWFFGSVTGRAASLPPFFPEDSPRSWGGGGGGGRGGWLRNLVHHALVGQTPAPHTMQGPRGAVLAGDMSRGWKLGSAPEIRFELI